jgi:hypothetical protein
MITKEDYKAIEKIIEDTLAQADCMVLGGGSTPAGIYVPWEPLFLPMGRSVCELKTKILDKIKELAQ